MWGSVREAGPGWWALAVAICALTNLLDFVALPAGGAPGPLLAIALPVRAGLVFWVAYAGLRRMAGRRDAARPAPALGRFAVFTLAMLIAFTLFSLPVARAVQGRPLATQWLAMLVAAGVWGVATIRLIGLSAAFADGARWQAWRAVVAATKGHAAPLAAAFAQLVLPFAAIHLAFTLLAVRLPFEPRALAALALLDGVVSAVQLLLTLALSHAAWRIDARRFP